MKSNEHIYYSNYPKILTADTWFKKLALSSLLFFGIERMDKKVGPPQRPDADTPDLVQPYIAAKGFGMNPAEEEVKTMQPFRPWPGCS